jgi:hypothetical protein
VEVPGPKAAPLLHRLRTMTLIPSQIGDDCTIKIRRVPGSEISWKPDEKFDIEKLTEVEINPGTKKAILIIIG